MITHTGVHVIPGGIKAPNERDLAVAMCRICRYAGALWVPLASHSILVGEFLCLETKRDLDFSLGLLHDGHETVTGEVTFRWKPPEMKMRERELDIRIFSYFGIDIDEYDRCHEQIKRADMKALCAEATILGYPGWAEKYREENGHDIPELSENEKVIGSAILEGGYWRAPGMIEEHSRQVQTLQQAFRKVKMGRHAEARQLLSVMGLVEES